LDKEYWKKIYAGKWEEGVNRGKKIISFVEPDGFEFEAHGFLAESTEYSKESPIEKGIPDYKVKDTNVLLETTGTKHARLPNDVWIRNDKFEYAENHPDSDCWLGHIIEEPELVRFMKLENKEKYPIKVKQIRGVDERFRIIPDGDPALKTLDEFKSHLKSK